MFSRVLRVQQDVFLKWEYASNDHFLKNAILISDPDLDRWPWPRYPTKVLPHKKYQNSITYHSKVTINVKICCQTCDLDISQKLWPILKLFVDKQKKWTNRKGKNYMPSIYQSGGMKYMQWVSINNNYQARCENRPTITLNNWHSQNQTTQFYISKPWVAFGASVNQDQTANNFYLIFDLHFLHCSDFLTKIPRQRPSGAI